MSMFLMLPGTLFVQHWSQQSAKQAALTASQQRIGCLLETFSCGTVQDTPALTMAIVQAFCETLLAA